MGDGYTDVMKLKIAAGRTFEKERQSDYTNAILITQKLAALYFKKLSDKVIKPIIDSDYFDVYHIFNIRHPERDALKKYLLDHGIKTEIHYPVAPNKQIAMREILSGTNTPIAQEIHDTTLSLPISFCHTKADVEYVCETVNNFVKT